jgi:hydrogenase maturation protease
MKPLLIFGYGNPSRGDDALGPRLLQRVGDAVEGRPIGQRVELLSDFQLQVEHALDLDGRELVIFADASLSANAPWEFSRVEPERDTSYSSHALSPAAVLDVCLQLHQLPLPPCFLLSIRGYSFELGDPLSDSAEINLSRSLDFVLRLLHSGSPLKTARERVQSK